MSEERRDKVAEPDHTRGAQALPRQPQPEPPVQAPEPAAPAAPENDE